jgi:hypothetical protein
MTDWMLAPVCLALLLGFIFYAFRAGMKVKPDRNNSEVGPTTNESYSGTEGGSDSGGHSF